MTSNPFSPDESGNQLPCRQGIDMNRALEQHIQNHSLHAPEMLFDLMQIVEELRPIPADRDRQGVALVKEHGLNAVVTVMKPECRLSGHVNRGPISIQVLDGNVRLYARGEGKSLSAGQMAVVDAHVEHEVVAETESAILMTIAQSPA